jgi:hypothetical protein
MRGVFGIVGLLVVVAIVGLLAKKQLTAGAGPVPAGASAEAAAPAPKQQVEQVRQAVDAAMQQAPRAMPEGEGR